MTSDQSNSKLDKIISIVRTQVLPVTGCTEPLSVAYSTAVAKQEIGGDIISLDVTVDFGLYKNAARVAIPGIERKGLVVAAALGATAGKAGKGLNVISDLSEGEIRKAYRLCDSGVIKVHVYPDCRDLYIKTEMSTTTGIVKVITQNHHTNITTIETGKDIRKFTPEETKEGREVAIRNYDLHQLLSLIELSLPGTWSFLAEGFKLNTALAETGLAIERGIGKTYQELFHSASTEWDAVIRAKTLCAAASQARMGGVKQNAMSIAGSGNHGITAFLGMKAVGEAYGIQDDRLYQAMALCILITTYIKTETGTLSAMCGCGVAAGIGLAAGVAFLLGGEGVEISGAMMNMVGSITGLLCDGAKEGCAFKLALSSGWAVESALLALRGVIIHSGDGIVDSNFQRLFRNLGLVCTSSEMAMNREIVQILENAVARNDSDCPLGLERSS